MGDKQMPDTHGHMNGQINMIMHKPIFQYREMKAGYRSVTQYLSTSNKNQKQP